MSKNEQNDNKCKQTSNKNVNKPAEAKYWQTAKQAASNSSTEKMAFRGEGWVALDNSLCKKSKQTAGKNVKKQLDNKCKQTFATNSRLFYLPPDEWQIVSKYVLEHFDWQKIIWWP